MMYRPTNQQQQQQQQQDQNNFNIGKYIPYDSRDVVFWRNAHLECEKDRKMGNRQAELKQLFKYSCLLEPKTRRGSVKCEIVTGDNYVLSCWISSYNCHPTTISIYNRENTNICLDFQPQDLQSMLRAIGNVVLCKPGCRCPQLPQFNFVDVPVWGGRFIMRFSKAMKDDVQIGFNLCQVNRRSLAKSVANPQIFKGIAARSTFISKRNIKKFRHMLILSAETIQLQYEVLSQQYATFEIADRKMKALTYSEETYKEIYYWTVMNTFYGLEILEGDRLPAYFVLREFLEQHLCEYYALYFNKECKCDNCKSVIISD